jgi:hypothetical protein
MAHRLTLLAAGAVATLVLASQAAYGATGSPPVTHPDTVTMHAGEGVQVDLTDNDGDPEGDSLAVCRLGTDVPKKLSHSFIADGDLVLLASRSAHGTYSFTYYACDASYLSPGTVTVTVEPPAPTLEVIPIGAQPGRMKIVNTYDRRTFACEWRPEDQKKAEGHATVKPHSTVVVRVHETRVEFTCTSGGVGYSFVFESGRSEATRR